ncbi:hypothetical protein OH77DRAFT_238548 [Trametes cingulata]|nr:hypothetical protein OH77DRAFT_238548 [Trametes cingulata]
MRSGSEIPQEHDLACFNIIVRRLYAGATIRRVSRILAQDGWPDLWAEYRSFQLRSQLHGVSDMPSLEGAYGRTRPATRPRGRAEASTAIDRSIRSRARMLGPESRPRPIEFCACATSGEVSTVHLTAVAAHGATRLVFPRRKTVSSEKKSTARAPFILRCSRSA